jgi:hypothetical protein
MNPLELKKKQVELQRVKVAKMELELKVEEREDEIKRLKEHIKIQELKELDLTKEIGG